MWYTQVYTPPVMTPAPPAIVRPVAPPPPALIRRVPTQAPLPLPLAVQQAIAHQPRQAAQTVTLGQPMHAAYAGRADLALAHFAKVLGVKLTMKTSLKGMRVALFGVGTVGSFLEQACRQLPADLRVSLNFNTHEMVVSHG